MRGDDVFDYVLIYFFYVHLKRCVSFIYLKRVTVFYRRSPKKK